MMTIKEFARLCDCNAQTLRYYDRIDLLKPVKVDPWSGYRYYEKAQAIDFVKIKNLQSADFSIDEIRGLLAKTDQEVYEAFSQKIAQQEQKLERIKEIQQSYLTEKSNMEKIIQGLTGFLLSQVGDFEGLREFGLEPEAGQQIMDHVRSYLDKWLLQSAPAEPDFRMLVNDQLICDADQIAEKVQSLTAENRTDTILIGDETLSQEDSFSPEKYETLWESHGWDHVYEFIDAIPKMEKGEDYCFVFHLNEETYSEDFSFPMFMLGAMIVKKGETEVCMGCAVERSQDSENHFALMRRKPE